MAVFGAAACAAPVDTGTSDAHGELTLDVASQERVAGTFVMDGVGIEFDLRYVGPATEPEGGRAYLEVARSVELRSLDGSELYLFDVSPEHYRVRWLDGEATVESTPEVVERLRGVDVDTPTEAVDTTGFEVTGDLRATIQASAAVPELQLLPFLSRALGVDAGLGGADYPVTMALHGLAMQHAEVSGLDMVGLQSETPEAPLVEGSGSEGSAATHDEPYCSYSFHCHYNNYRYGQCGPEGTCWWWVCYSCCKMRDCSKHDFATHACYSHGHAWWCAEAPLWCRQGGYHDMQCAHYRRC